MNDSVDIAAVIEFVSSLNPLGIYFYYKLSREYLEIDRRGLRCPLHQAHEPRRNPRTLVYLNCHAGDLLVYGWELAEWAAQRFCGVNPRTAVNMDGHRNWKRESWRVAIEMLERIGATN